MKDIENYDRISIEAALPSGVTIYKIYERNYFPELEGEWRLYYETDSQLPFCPIYGDFRKCGHCIHWSIEMEDIDDLDSFTFDCKAPWRHFGSDYVIKEIKLAEDAACRVYYRQYVEE